MSVPSAACRALHLSVPRPRPSTGGEIDVWSPRSSRAGGGDPTAAAAAGGADPDAVAQSYWHVHTQDKSAWTQEMDIRSPSFM